MDEVVHSSPRVTADGGVLAPMVTYAQNCEDVLLRRALQDVENGYYVDIGGYDPIANSVTHWFYEAGWRGINVEPDPNLIAPFRERRPRDTNLACAVSRESGRATFSIAQGTGLSHLASSGTPPTSGEHIKIDVEVMSLPALLDEYVDAAIIDFLKIDAEGAEEDIIRGADFTKHRPRIVLVEATAPLTQNPAWEAWEPILLASGYSFVWFDGLNRFYLREEDSWRSRYFELPPCVFDNFEPWPQRAMSTHIASLTSQVTNLVAQVTDLTFAFNNMEGMIEHLKQCLAAETGRLREQKLRHSELNDIAEQFAVVGTRVCRSIESDLMHLWPSKKRLMTSARRGSDDLARLSSTLAELRLVTSNAE